MTTKPIRVAQVVGRVVTGGVDAVIMNYYRHIDRENIQFDFIMDGYESTPIDAEIESMGGRVYKVIHYSSSMIKNMMQCYRIFKNNRYQIVHANLNTLNVFPLAMAWLAGVQIRICHSHSTAAKGEGKKTVMKYILRPFAKVFSTHYFACSELAGRWLFGNRCYDKGKVTLVRNAIDINKYSYNQEVRNDMRNKMNLDDKFVVGHVGRFVYQKNHEYLIDIFSEVHRLNPDSILMLVGDGELQEQMRKKVHHLHLEKVVLFLGVRHDVPKLMQAMDVLVLPSWYEGLGMVAIEAQAAGLQVLVSDSVSVEAAITSLIKFYNLNEITIKWAQRICDNQRGARTKMDEWIARAGFEIRHEAKTLENCYRYMLNYER